MELAAITSVLSGIKVATDVASSLWKGKFALEAGELKLKLLEIIDSLVAANLSIVEIQKELVANVTEIARLREALKIKDDVVMHLDAYYKKNETGLPSGNPYCLRCYESDSRLFHLVFASGGIHEKICTQCKTKYNSRNCVTIE